MGSIEKSDELYILGRDKEESQRLNKQHAFLVELSGMNLFHPSIPKDRIFSVADIATGTGIWLRDVCDMLKQKAPSDSPRYYHGFDISSQQFPEDSDINFSVQDVLKPFPAEHLGRYDLVHVRLLVGGLKTVDYKTAVENVVSLLKPGGYLQWEEVDDSAFNTNDACQPKIIEEIRDLLMRSVAHLGLSFQAPQWVYNESVAAGLKNVITESYTTASQPHLQPAAGKWLTGVFRAIVPGAMLRSGEVKDEKEAMQKANEIADKFEQYCASGVQPLGNLKMIVGQKP